MRRSTIDGALFAQCIISGTSHIETNRQAINELNVFPVPDGDTGDNMFMTMKTASSNPQLKNLKNLDKVTHLVAQDLLLGARGNSGVILSRIFAGIAKDLQKHHKATAMQLTQAFASGVTESYKAVAKPVEGTMLTVFQDAVAAVRSQITEKSTINDFFDILVPALQESLKRTPELLPVLKEADVVDSGGAGLAYLFIGMQHALHGHPDRITNKDIMAESLPNEPINLSLFTADDVLEFGYCTELLLRLQNSKVNISQFDLEVMNRSLGKLGDSLVTSRDDSIVKIHIHTMRPSQVLEYCQQFGEFLKVKIENITLQHHGIQQRARPNKPHKKYGIIAVADGEGVKETFTELGCDVVIKGGQSMNPSVNAFVQAFKKLNVDHVLVFPNNPNIILTAKQAAQIFEKASVHVVPSNNIGEGYTAISMLDTNISDVEELISDVCRNMRNVTTGFIAKASRNVTADHLQVKKGHFIGFVDKQIYVDDARRSIATHKLISKIRKPQHSLGIIVFGANVPASEAKRLQKQLQAQDTDMEYILIDGGQTTHDYVLILE